MRFDEEFTQERYPNSRNPRSVQMGLEFQDYVSRHLLQIGIICQVNSSSKYQLEEGESPQRVEIKLDQNCIRTGRLSIEVEERSSFRIKHWTPSGIYSKNDSTFYVQGTYGLFYVFHTPRLREYHQVKYKGKFQQGPDTIRKFFLPFPIADALKIAKAVEEKDGQLAFYFPEPEKHDGVMTVEKAGQLKLKYIK